MRRVGYALGRTNAFFAHWWPLLASVVGLSILATMALISLAVEEDRDRLRAERDQLEFQAAQLDELVERQREIDASREARLGRAVDEVEGLLVDYFALHDENVAQKLNDTLHRIEVLLGRPAGTPPEPVAAKPAPRAAPTPAPSGQSPRTRTTEAPAAQPAPSPTTSPDQKSCARRPNGPRC